MSIHEERKNFARKCESHSLDADYCNVSTGALGEVECPKEYRHCCAFCPDFQGDVDCVDMCPDIGLMVRQKTDSLR